MKLVVTGAMGFLGWRAAMLLAQRGHDVVPLARAGGRPRSLAPPPGTIYGDAGDPRVRELLNGADAVLHFAGVPDPTKANLDPLRAVRENVGTTVNLLEACAEHRHTGLVYPSSVRAAVEPPPDAYGLSKRLGEDACRLHRAPATVLRLTSVFGPGQVAAEGATGAIASFAARALAGEPLVIPGNPGRTRDFTYVDDVVSALERLVTERRWNETVTLATGIASPLRRAAELVLEATGSTAPIETPGGALTHGEDESYGAPSDGPGLAFHVRPLEEAIPLYVDWLRRHTAA